MRQKSFFQWSAVFFQVWTLMALLFCGMKTSGAQVRDGSDDGRNRYAAPPATPDSLDAALTDTTPSDDAVIASGTPSTSCSQAAERIRHEGGAPSWLNLSAGQLQALAAEEGINAAGQDQSRPENLSDLPIHDRQIPFSWLDLSAEQLQALAAEERAYRPNSAGQDDRPQFNRPQQRSSIPSAEEAIPAQPSWSSWDRLGPFVDGPNARSSQPSSATTEPVSYPAGVGF